MSIHSGTLFIVATPIGNVKDITDRAKEILRSVHFVASEDTRHTGMLLKRLDIRARLISFHEHSGSAKVQDFLSELMTGKNMALVSDAGTPLVSDPGFPLVQQAIEQGIRVEGIPGPCALINALVISGFASSPFSFFGFLPNKDKKKHDLLTNVSQEKRTLIFYESPHRLIKTLQVVSSIFGERRVVVTREMTKKFEEVIRGTAAQIISHFGAKSILGEIVIVIEGVPKK